MSWDFRSKLSCSLLLAALMLIAGCAVGPNFNKPAAPDVKSYTAEPLSSTSSTTNVGGGGRQVFVEGGDIPGEWWKLFHSQALNNLIERALTNNPTIKSAQAALQAAGETTKAQKGVFWPSVDGSFAATRQSSPQTLAPVPNANVFTYSLFTPEVTVSYVPDVFGLNRRTVESFKAVEQQQRYALLEARITLSANVVSAAVNEASLRSQIAATTNLISENTRALNILRAQFSNGYASQLDLAGQESQLAQLTATLPPLRRQLAQQRDALAVLVGTFPSRGPAEKFELSKLQLPEEIPLSLPSQLVEQRPDVLQAQEAWHSASAQVGVAIANRLPNITLTANAGNSALAIDQLFTSGTGFWTLGAAATQPIFRGFALLHQERAAKALYVQAAEQYRATVLNAFQNVADTLNALEQDGEALKTAAAAEHSARVTLNLTEAQLQTGYASYLTLVTAETAYQQAVIAVVQAQANRYADTAALFLSLGGGWWHRADFAGK
jgi:NodT family efflux transporter outer membrane factor (OMF) lipoprotein